MRSKAEITVQIRQIDVAITQAINGLSGAGGLLDQLMVGVSAIGIPLIVASVALQWWVTSNRPHHRHILVSTGLSFLTGLAINQLILMFFHRVRPYELGISKLIVAPSLDPSFPSDHATAGFAIAAAFLLKRCQILAGIYASTAAFIALSRIFVGTHYFSDVVGGALTAFVAAVLVQQGYREGSLVDKWLVKLL